MANPFNKIRRFKPKGPYLFILLFFKYLFLALLAYYWLLGCKIRTGPPPAPINDKIKAVMWKPVECTVHWVNRGDLPIGTPEVFADDGSCEQETGVAYGTGCDDYDEFLRKMNIADPHHLARLWSFYTCVPPNDPNLNKTFKPAARGYADGNCSACCNRTICYEADIEPGLPHPNPTCTWNWAGARCFCTTTTSLFEADGKLRSIISMGNDQNTIHDALINSGYGHVVTHDEIKEGDLVFMNLGFSRPGIYDHIAIISYVDPNHNWYNDRCIGNIGFYPDPFYYKACEASMIDHDDAINYDWPWFYRGNPQHNEDWGLTPGRCEYVRVFDGI